MLSKYQKNSVLKVPGEAGISSAYRNLYLMAYKVKRVSAVDVLCVTIGSMGMIRVLKRSMFCVLQLDQWV